MDSFVNVIAACTEQEEGYSLLFFGEFFRILGNVDRMKISLTHIINLSIAGYQCEAVASNRYSVATVADKVDFVWVLALSLARFEKILQLFFNRLVHPVFIKDHDRLVVASPS